MGWVWIAPALIAQPVDLTVKLQPFHVQALSTEFRLWSKLTSPNFVLYTDAPIPTGEKVLRECEAVAFALEQILQRAPTNLPPVIIVLPTSRSDWRQLEAKRGMEWRASALVTTARPQSLVTIFYDWQNEDWGSIRSSVAKGLLSRLEWEGPFWFSMGVGLLFDSADVQRDRLSIVARHLLSATERQSRLTGAKAGTRDAADQALIASNDWGGVLQVRGTMRWDKVLMMHNASPEFLQIGKVDQFLAQSALMTHWLLFSADGPPLRKLSDWRSYQLGRIAADEAIFERVIGQDWRKWGRTMRGYGNLRPTREFAFAAEAPRFQATPAPLTTREMRELFILAQVLRKNDETAAAAMDALPDQEIKSASLQALWITALAAQGRDGAVWALLAKSIEQETTNAFIYELAAESRFQLLVPTLRVGARLEAEDYEELRALLQRALKLEPGLAKSARLLAWVEAFQPEPARATVTFVENLRNGLGGRTGGDEIEMAGAICRLRTGDAKGAREIALRLDDPANASVLVERLAKEILAATQP